ncbi:MAG: M18 family aminopeptidase [Bacteroidales bacterium]|nr:M18 family aminopeptidase [Bacteroidales bacterium]
MLNRLLSFLDASPVNFLAVEQIRQQLEAAGFTRIDPTQPLPQLEAGAQVYVTKNDSAIFAFRLGRKTLGEAGFKMICAHSDSPCFRIKPAAEMVGEAGLVRLNTEVYGGPILSTWFDRPLSIAGRVLLRTDNPLHPETRLLHVKRPVMIIPNLAIHFNRQVNDGVKLNRQKDMLPVMGYVTDQLEKDNLLLHLIAKELGVDKSAILDFDLYLCDAQPACLCGLHDEFISSGRLDDLSMCYAGLEALLAAPQNDMTQVLAIFDNEETGSGTKQGAASPFLRNMLERLVLAQGGTQDDLYRAIEQAFMVSADNAHAFHPNHAEKADPTNHPRIGGGPVIKFNAAQKYASDADSASVFAEVCRLAGVPCQKFVNHSEIAGGSTLGNILAASIPLRGVDMGNGIWAMHSARETGAAIDHIYCVKAFTKFYEV